MMEHLQTLAIVLAMHALACQLATCLFTSSARHNSLYKPIWHKWLIRYFDPCSIFKDDDHYYPGW